MTLADFEGFVREHQDMVYTTALRLLGREHEAQDIAQEAFLRAFERQELLAGHENPGGWLRTVTTNLCLNHLERYRKRWRLFSELDTEDGEAFEDSLAAPAPSEAAEAAPAGLEAALMALPDHQRVPIILFHYEELPYEDIARKLGVSLGKLKTDIFRGRAALRKALSEETV
jgi:RNA polymerase sigma-70 factor (ECF subfamily)